MVLTKPSLLILLSLIGLISKGSFCSSFYSSIHLLRKLPLIKRNTLSKLKESDPEIFQILRAEEKRQISGLNLIASENFVSSSVLEALGSVLTNKYSEGQPYQRYYGGNENIDQLECLCQRRALECFGLDPLEWGVNVQSYSGSPANFAVYTALLEPQEKLMGLGLKSGGHLTHGYFTEKRKVSASSIYFESRSYHVNQDGLIDYDQVEQVAKEFQPKLLICGASSYPREWDYERMKSISKECGAVLMTDMSHTSGLVASQVVASPFKHSQIVTTTTHKSLRGPRAALIFYRLKYKAKIDAAVFPGLQGGPHNNQIAATAVALGEAMQPDFKTYANRVVSNARVLAQCLADRGYKIVTNGTDNHIVLWDVRPLGLSGTMVEQCLDKVGISVNKNTLLGDSSVLHPGGVRLGTCALTTRGMGEQHMAQVALLLHRGVSLALKVRARASKGKSISEFVSLLIGSEFKSEVQELKAQVENIAQVTSIPQP